MRRVGHNGGRHAGASRAYDERATVEEVMSMPLSCDAKDAAKILGVSVKHIEKQASEGAIPACRVGRVWRFSTRVIIGLLEGTWQPEAQS